METYSDTWFETFLRQVSPEKTDREVAFLKQHIPQERFPRVLDICCGLGRHAHALALGGYRVVGVDRDPRILADAARAVPGNPTYVALDARHLAALDEEFDAAIIMWASFGYFSSHENDALLRSVAGKIRSGGRVLLDIYHRAFFEEHQGVTLRDVNGRTFEETREIVGSRLRVSLDYRDGGRDDFEWELFTPSELAVRAWTCGLEASGAWTQFDDAVEAHSGEPRFQMLLTKS